MSPKKIDLGEMPQSRRRKSRRRLSPELEAEAEKLEAEAERRGGGQTSKVPDIQISRKSNVQISKHPEPDPDDPNLVRRKRTGRTLRRMCIYVPPELHARLEDHCHQEKRRGNRLTQSDVISLALAAFLDQPG